MLIVARGKGLDMDQVRIPHTRDYDFYVGSHSVLV